MEPAATSANPAVTMSREDAMAQADAAVVHILLGNGKHAACRDDAPLVDDHAAIMQRGLGVEDGGDEFG